MADIIVEKNAVDDDIPVDNENILSGISGLEANISKFLGDKNAEIEAEPETETETAEEQPKVDTEVPEKKPEDLALERVAAKEAEVRSAREQFDRERKAFEESRKDFVNLKDFDENPFEALTKAGKDPDFIMKKILFHKLPDDNPVKAKLKTELADYLRDKQISDLKKEISAKEEAQKQAAESQRFYQETESRINTFSESFKSGDNKTLPHLSQFGKKDGGTALIKELVLAEMVKDAQDRYIKGDNGDPIDHEEAAKRVERLIAKFAPFFKNEAVQKKNTVVQQKKLVPKEPVPNKETNTTVAQEIDSMIAGVLSNIK